MSDRCHLWVTKSNFKYEAIDVLLFVELYWWRMNYTFFVVEITRIPCTKTFISCLKLYLHFTPNEDIYLPVKYKKNRCSWTSALMIGTRGAANVSSSMLYDTRTNHTTIEITHLKYLTLFHLWSFIFTN